MDTLARLCQQKSLDDFTEVAIEVSKECEMEIVHFIEPVKVRQVSKSQQDVRYNVVGVVPINTYWLVEYLDARDHSGHGFPQDFT